MKITSFKIILLVVTVLLCNENQTFAQDKTNHYFTFLITNPNRPEISDEKAEEIQAAHIANIDRLKEEKIMIFASPFDGGGGVFIYQTKSIEETLHHLNTDPAIKAKRHITETYAFNFDKGRIGETPPKVEWTTYSFIKLKLNENDKNQLKIYNDFVNGLDEQNLVVIEGPIANYGKVIFLKEKDDIDYQAYFDNHELSKLNNIKAEFKKLWSLKNYLFRK